MQIRRNTKSFKTILEIVTTCQTRPDRQNFIRLYITKAGRSIKDRIGVEGIQGEAGVFYDLGYQAVLNNLKSPTHQLYQSDDEPGVYFFHSSNKDWDETPFEFDARTIKEFSSLPELPVAREKGATVKYSLSAPPPGAQAKPAKKETAKETAKEKVVENPTMFVSKGPKQPDYKLKHEFRFTDLDKVVFRKEGLSKKDILDHYNRMADYLLPYLKDRPHSVRVQSDGGPNIPRNNLAALPQKGEREIPGWVQNVPVAGDQMFLCNDKEHLLFYVQNECIEFDPCHLRKNTLGSPDYIVIGLESGSEFIKLIDVAHATKEILDGLHLHSLLKTDGVSGLHLYIPLDSKSDFETAGNVAELLCKLVRLKIPDLVALKGSHDKSYGKIELNHLLNQERVGVVAPYSFVAGGPATIATPILWEEVTEDLKIEDFNHESIFDRLKSVGDPFEDLFKKKANAYSQLEKLTEHYSFLL